MRSNTFRIVGGWNSHKARTREQICSKYELGGGVFDIPLGGGLRSCIMRITALVKCSFYL